jgi:hypothetical protein
MINYDSVDGIKQSLVSLAKFNELREARAEACYGRGERLVERIVLGRFLLDSCGNFGSLVNPKVGEDFSRDCPKVLTRKEFDAYYDGKIAADGYYSFGMGAPLPSAQHRCPECQGNWVIENCHDVVEYRGSHWIDLSSYKGKSLSEVNAALDCEPELPQWICEVKSESGNSVKVPSDHIVQEGDRAYTNWWRFLHSDCNATMLRREANSEWRQMLQDSGFDQVAFTSIPNGYSKGAYAKPWAKVELFDGQSFVIGVRSRVYVIDFSGTSYRGDITKGADVDKSYSYAHAWSKDDLLSYLQELRVHIA